MSYIELKNIKKSFGEKEILKDVNLSIEKGEFVTFLGPSGCGKTTLLRCLTGLETIDSGTFFLDGIDVTSVPASQRGISMIFQQYCLFPTMNVYDNVSFGLRMKSVQKSEIQSRVKKVLDMVNLTGHEKKYLYQLSGGEQQRAALARGLIMNPKVLFLDEPFSAIDAKLRKELQIYLKQIHKELNMTSIFVTHDQEEAMRISDTIHLFNNGILEQSGVPQDVYANPKTKFVASFIGNYNQIPSEHFVSFIAGKALPTANKYSKTAAIRPEIIELSSNPFKETHDFYYAKGQIKNYITHGNIIRYSIASESSTLNADVIFNNSLEWNVGENVYMRVKKENVLFL